MNCYLGKFVRVFNTSQNRVSMGVDNTCGVNRH